MRENGILFLMYHEIESPGKSPSNTEPGYVRYVVTEASFKLQMELMRANGVLGVSVTQALDQLKKGLDGCIALTFDDGCETDLLVAVPILRDLGFNATAFIVAGLVGTAHCLSSNQLRELHRSGVEIGSHSMTHRHLTDLPDKELAHELRLSKDTLEQIIGDKVVHLSCPNGRWNSRVAMLAQQAGYKSISTSRIARNFSHTDPLNLARFPMMRETSREEFAEVISGMDLVSYQRKAGVLKIAKQALGNRLYDKLRSMLLGRTG